MIIRSTQLPNKKLSARIITSEPFASEDSLISIVVRNIKCFVAGDNIFASTEIPVGAGTVDIVAGQIGYLERSEHVAVTGIEAYILSLLHYKQRLKAATIAKKAALPLLDVEGILIRLRGKGYSVMSGSCYLRAKSPVVGLAAVEGKRKNWRRALKQAHRNRLFTSQTFVALDARYSRPALKNLHLFKEYRVGLALVFSDGDICIIYRPPRNEPITPILPIVAETALLERMNIGE